ncbi:hypothetical protein J7443_12895 [Tropicibacter sp. R15_0]|uniref:hypothetical protein n=1 Tax=Tropicibacter sp. R15_0 TaxID=2821101 RepID=UPI001ADC4409|nr:hypothetical protein [Tropicibacter sp. R15_0]MBO9466134.1 hypothetical protein [Tropicibacter sp. R15_0]
MYTDRERQADELEKRIKMSIWIVFPIAFLSVFFFMVQYSSYYRKCADTNIPPTERLEFCDRAERRAKVIFYFFPAEARKETRGEKSLLRSRAIAHAELGDSEEALALFKRSIALWPKEIQELRRPHKIVFNMMERETIPQVAQTIWLAALTEHLEAP